MPIMRREMSVSPMPPPSQPADPVLRERLQDLDDIANRLLSILAGGGMRNEVPDNAILICRSIGPTELLDYDRRKLKGW